MPSVHHGFVLRESGLHDPGYQVVRDSATWQTRWQLIAGSYTPAATIPWVDFRQNTVLVAALGFASPMGARYPAFVEAVQRGDTVVATLEVTICAKTNDGGDAPVALAIIPSHIGPVAFITRQMPSRNCSQ